MSDEMIRVTRQDMIARGIPADLADLFFDIFKRHEAEVSKLRSECAELRATNAAVRRERDLAYEHKESEAREEGALSMYDTIHYFWTDNEHGWDALVDRETALGEWRKRAENK